MNFYTALNLICLAINLWNLEYFYRERRRIKQEKEHHENIQ